VDLLDDVGDALAGTGARHFALRASRSSALARRLETECGFARREADCHFEVRPLDPAFSAEQECASFDYRYLDHDIF
jgi:hypothetical protein